MGKINGKKNSKFIVFAIIIMFLLLGTIIATCFYLPAASKISNKLDIYELKDGWELVKEDGSREKFTGFNKKYEADKMTIAHSMEFIVDGKEVVVDSIACQTFYSAVEIKINGVTVKTYGVEEIKQNKRTLVGNLYLAYHFEGSYSPTDEISYTFTSATGDIYILPIEVGTEDDLLIGEINKYFSVLITLFVSVLAFVIIISMGLSKRTKDYIHSNYLYFAIFFGGCTVWELLDSQYLMYLGLPAGPVSFASNEIFMLLPLGLITYIYATCKYNTFGRVIDVLLFFLVLSNFFAQNYAYFAGQHTILDTMFATHAVAWLTFFVTILQSFVNWMQSCSKKNEERHKDMKYLRTIFFGLLIFCAGCTYQLYSFYLDPSESNTGYMRAGIIIFGVLIIINIIRRINDDVEYEKKKNIDSLWEEKVKVENVRSIMNEAFKTIIPEQYIDDVMEAYRKKDRLLKESPDGTIPDEDMIIKIGHSRRVATILVSDVRGFSEISTKYDQRVGDMLNHYLGSMTDIVEKYGGHVLEFMGDGILAGFGTIEQDKYQADNAVKAAIEMQKMMPEINAWNEKNGFPGQLEIGIGINTGNVFSGIIGSLDRFKFDVLGQEVNLASRIETYTTGGQILISQKTKEAVVGPIGTYKTIKATPKGSDVEQTYFLVNACGDISYDIKGDELKKLNHPIKVEFKVFEDKGNAKNSYSGVVTHLSENSIFLQTTAKVKLEVFDIVTVIHNGGVTCKVTKLFDNGYELRFTSPNKRNDGKPIFEDVEEEAIDEYEELEAETKRLLRKKREAKDSNY